MKKVVENSTVAHLWANQTQDEARNPQHNFYFEGKTIYSYRNSFPIAQHVEHKGKKMVLFTTQTYSVTTAGHISIVRYASNHLDKIYCHKVDYNSGYYAKELHESNFNQWIKEVEYIAPKLVKARKPEIYLNQIGQIAEQVKKYAEFFGIKIPAILKKVIEVSNTDQYIEYNKNKIAIIQREEAKKLRESLKKWRNFETYRLSNRIDRDYLRYNAGEKVIETSQNVKITIPEAKKLFTAWKNGKLKEGIKVRTIIGEYSIDKVNGFIKIGCHNIEFKEAELIAKTLNW